MRLASLAGAPSGLDNRRRLRVFLASSLLSVAGCAGLPRADQASLIGEALSGRLAVGVQGDAGAPGRSVSAAFVLQGDERIGKLDLATPFGSTLAQARWSPGQVALVTPRGEERFDDLDALTREVLGESLPVAALFDWLRGRPWPGSPATVTDAGFEQLGWRVDLTRFDAAAAIDARRAAPPVMTVRARMDRTTP